MPESGVAENYPTKITKFSDYNLDYLLESLLRAIRLNRNDFDNLVCEQVPCEPDAEQRESDYPDPLIMIQAVDMGVTVKANVEELIAKQNEDIHYKNQHIADPDPHTVPVTRQGDIDPTKPIAQIDTYSNGIQTLMQKVVNVVNEEVEFDRRVFEEIIPETWENFTQGMM